MSQHSSCWLARHQFFIKYCIAEKETFKGEEKIEFAVSTQALMISAFYKVINWLYKRKKQVVLQKSTGWVLSTVLLFSFLKHLNFPLPEALHAWQEEWVRCMTKSVLFVPLLLPRQIPVWQPTCGKNGLEQGTTLFWCNLIPIMHFTLSKEKKIKEINFKKSFKDHS